MRNAKSIAERDSLNPVRAIHVEADDSWDCYFDGDDMPTDPHPPQVAECSPWQLRRKLNQIGARAAVEAYVAASPDQDVKDGWEFASKYVSTDPFVVTACAALGIDPYATISSAAEIQ